jgi:hypothetical protein
MAKIVPTNIKLSGRYGNDVHVQSNTFDPYVRKAPKTGTRKDEPAFKAQHSRTRTLNTLAGEITSIIDRYYPNFKRAELYRRILKHFRKEPLDHRCLLLQQLKGMEINEDYKFSWLGQSWVKLAGVKKKILVSLHVLMHPLPGTKEANSYYFDLLLFTWDKSKKPAMIQRQMSEWVYLKNGEPEFEFEFDKPTGIKQWLLCVRIRLGINEKEIEANVAEGIQFADAGSFDKQDLALMENMKTEKEAQRLRNRVAKPVEEVVRVKAKRVK